MPKYAKKCHSTTGVKIVRKRLADGTVKEYFYPKRKKQPSRPVAAEGSVGQILKLYYESPEFLRTKPKTRENKRNYLMEMEKIAARPLRDVSRRMLTAVRDSMAHKRGAGAANCFISITKTFLNWAISRDWLEINPAQAIRLLPKGELPAWTKETVAQAQRNLSPALQRVVILGVFTGQRRGDLCRMKWEDIRGNFICLTQEKTGMELKIPIHPVLADHLQKWRGDSPYILTTATGKPWQPSVLSAYMYRSASAGKIPAGFNVHGLRKLAATLLAEAGCSTHEIAAITGHKTLAMVQHYTLSASQEKLATEAIRRMETGFWKPQETDK